jgi:hypothetical protein
MAARRGENDDWFKWAKDEAYQAEKIKKLAFVS